MTQSTLEDLEALLLLSRTPGIRMHGLKPFFEQKGTSGTSGASPLFKKPAEILDWIIDNQAEDVSRNSSERRFEFRGRDEALKGLYLL